MNEELAKLLRNLPNWADVMAAQAGSTDGWRSIVSYYREMGYQGLWRAEAVLVVCALWTFGGLALNLWFNRVRDADGFKRYVSDDRWGVWGVGVAIAFILVLFVIGTLGDQIQMINNPEYVAYRDIFANAVGRLNR